MAGPNNDTPRASTSTTAGGFSSVQPIVQGSSSTASQTAGAAPQNTHFVQNIPQLMHQKGWLQGEALQQKWFGSSENELVGQAKDGIGTTGDLAIDTTTITMKWVLSYTRAKAVYDEIFSQQLYMNRAARDRLHAQLAANQLRRVLIQQPFALLSQGTPRFKFGGDPGQNVRLREQMYVNSRPCIDPATHNPLKADALTAALANFNFFVLVEGEAAPTGKGFDVSISSVGVYIRDSFDFEDDPSALVSQPLGVWKLPGWTSRPHYVNNADYRAYRNDTHMGADFLIYSDIMWTKLFSPVNFTLP